jgi:peptide/nickel transport system ATP-binding protein
MSAGGAPLPAGSVEPTLRVEGLTVSYRHRGRPLRVIDNLSLHVAPGEAFGLVGESGCGKTTVAMAVMRYLPRNAVVEAGRILLGGRDLLAASEGDLRAFRGNRMAMVYQDPGSALNPSMPIGRQIAEVYRFHRGLSIRDAMSAARGMLEKVQVSDPDRMLGRYPHELSGGQQQRIMFAMALATNPDLLVLDEPTTGLDATVEAEVLDLVERLRAEFRTAILFITHNLGVVTRICERVGVLYAGRLLEEGPSHSLFTDPRHPYTLGLLRCVPRLGMRKDLRRLDPIPGSLPPVGAVPPGCVYAPRCPIARPRCRAEVPPNVRVDAARSSACFYPEDVPAIPPSPETGTVYAADGEAGRVLAAEGLTKAYRSAGLEITAVAGVSFEIRRGEVLGLVGESGSGKSTLAKCIAGLIDASSGRISLDGAELTAVARSRTAATRRKLQMVFQNPDTSLNPSHTVRRILGRAVTLLSGPHSRQDIDAAVARLAASVRLAPRHLDLRPGALSGGLKQRVAIARAFAGAPLLVLCDEPTSALDVSVQAAILNVLADLQGREHVSYLFISHDLGIVRYLADRIAVMYLGQIVEIGSAEAVFNPPHHPYTEALFSAMPTLDSENQPARIRLGGTVPSLAQPPSGCRFHPRCPRMLGDVCRFREPPWQRDATGHSYRCHIPPEELRRAQTAPAPSEATPGG